MPASALAIAGRGVVVERGAQLGVGLDLVLHLPERLDRVPVAVRDRGLQAAGEPRVDLALDLGDRRAERERGRELGEVDHPVDLPVAIVDVDRVLQQHGQRDELERVHVDAVEVGEVALDLGPQALAPPARELRAVVRQHGAEIAADAGRIPVEPRHARDVAGVVLGALDRDVVGRNRGRVEVAVDVLGDPVGRERRAEAPEHVIAGQPPAADVEEHRRQRVGAVQVVEDPQPLALTRVPRDRERVVPVEGPRTPSSDMRPPRCQAE